MTYNVFGGTLNLAQSQSHAVFISLWLKSCVQLLICRALDIFINVL